MAIFQDLRFSLRSLAKSPGFTLAAVLTLALGIGANTAVFSFVNGVLLRPLAYRDPGRLYTLWLNLEKRDGPRAEWAGRSLFSDWRRENRSFAGLAAWGGFGAELTGDGEPESLPGLRVSPALFDLLGVRPALGRSFSAEEETPGRDQVVMLTDGLWRRRFGADRSLPGKTIEINGQSFTVAGVLPPGFRFELEPDAALFAPLPIDPAREDYGAFYIRVVGRLRDGVSPLQAQADLDRVAALLGSQHPEDLADTGITLTPLKQSVVGDSQALLIALFAASLLVLLIACTNVANLLLARAGGRERELALRSSLGASRGRLVRQLLTESLLLALAGGLAGLLLGGWGMDLLRWLAPQGTPRLDEVSLNLTVLAFTFAAALTTGLVFGLAPALGLVRRQSPKSLREGSQGGGTPGRSRLRSLLVVGEVALGLVLLVAAGLLIRSLGALSQVDPGFRPQQVVSGTLLFPSARIPDEADLVPLLDRMLARLAARPQVEAVGAVSVLPLSGSQTDISVAVEGRLPKPGQEPGTDYRIVSPGYFAAMGIPLLQGRLFAAEDGPTGTRTVVVSERFAERFLPGEDPLGKRVRLGEVQSAESPWWTIVGVVGGVRDNQLDRAPDPEIYTSFQQFPVRRMTLVARVAGAPATALPLLRQAVADVDPSRPLAHLDTLENLVARSLAPTRFVAYLLASFAALALVLAAVGIYGVVAHAVGERRREIGIRMAVGAEIASILRMVLAWGGRLLAIGLGLGLLAALAASRLLVSLLYGVGPADPATLAVVTGLLGLVALGACYLPARAASRIDPALTLKAE